ncbi:porin [Vibrio sp. Isolate23]|uniref:porin n=1 Tax=Vibrio sp. Isolate23 TaxID=2908533 RepID=UPI001EFE47CE|nr:porin [Vibrio sp. Isolate23]MCG9682126.1 porin [Vibrio sp. Isolate23]
MEIQQRSLLIIALISPPTIAQVQLTNELSLSGFGTFSAAKSDNNTPVFYGRDITHDWCFDCDSTLGLQLDWQLLPNLRSVLQGLKRPQDAFSSPTLERAFLEYSAADHRIKVGRLRSPMFIMSEYYYVSSTYPWLRLPVDVYGGQLGITHFEGTSVELNYEFLNQFYLSLTPFYALANEEEYELYGQSFTLDVKSAYGLGADFYFEDSQLHLSYTDVEAQQTFTNQHEIFFNIHLLSLGVSYTINAWHFQAETLLSNELYSNWYAGVDYRLSKWTPYVQYGQSRKSKMSNSYLFGVRYYFTTQINTSLEWQRIEGQKNVISGQFTQLQNSSETFASKVDLISIGLSFTF